jgi:RNA polymerase sigma-70 factor (ECF subfamily)
MTEGEIEIAFRREAGPALATLIRLLGDFDLAEDSLQDAFAKALTAWRRSGPPGNARAWLIRAARNRAVDQLRRRASLNAKTPMLEIDAALDRPDAAGDDSDIAGDDTLRLIFTCCHPALAMEARVALTLRTVCGLATPSIARAFLVSEETMAQRLVRAKAKIKAAGVPYRVPPPDLLPERLEGVLAVIYLVFTEDYADVGGGDRGLADEAIRLARLVNGLMPGEAGVQGLLALMLLQDARRAARTGPDGAIVRLEDQDRSLWDRGRIGEGVRLVEAALGRRGRPDAYAIQAAIAALHAQADRFEATDWPQIAGLYEVLLRVHPSPVIELNHAVAVSMVDGPARALNLIDSLNARGGLAGYHLLHVARADMLRRLKRGAEAAAAYRRALALAPTAAEKTFLRARIAELDKPIP